MANIKLNNNEYLIPDSVLAEHTADFVAHLRTIAGNGSKIVIGGVEYGIDTNKISNAFSNLETALGVLSGDNSIQLMSIDNFALKDSNGLYLTVKEDN